MNNSSNSGRRRLHEIESFAYFVLWSRCRPSPCARLGFADAPEPKESPDRSARAGRTRPVPRKSLAENPSGLGGGGLRFPIQESFARNATARAPRAPACRVDLSGCLTRRFRGSATDGKSDCGVVSGSGRDARVREAAPYSKVFLAVPDDSMEAVGGLRPIAATGRPE